MIVSLDRLGRIVDTTSGEEWSGSRLADECDVRAARLRGLGVGPGSRALIRHGGTQRFFADLLALWQVGACAACLNPELTKSELENISAFLEPTLAVAAPDTRHGADLGLRSVVLDDSSLPRKAALPTDDFGRLDDPALILFTSGTTGTPKGVVHSFRSLVARFSLNREHIPHSERLVTLCPLPTHFGHGLIGNALTPLLDGNTLIMMRGSNLRSAASTGSLIDQHGVTFMSSVPAFWKIVTKSSPPPTRGTLRRVHVGSAPLSAELWRRIIDWGGSRNVVNMYGITETANWIAGASSIDHDPEDGLVGRPWGGQACVMGEDGHLRSTGEGELVVLTPSLMEGYFARADLSAQSIKGGWFRTGDIGRIGEDNVIRLVGRKKHEINRAGLKVHPEDIDVLLERHEAIREACAFGIPDDIAGEIVGVAIAPLEGRSLDVLEIKRWAADRLTREKLPERWYILPDIPKTDRGKVNRENVARACTQLTAR